MSSDSVLRSIVDWYDGLSVCLTDSDINELGALISRARVALGARKVLDAIERGAAGAKPFQTLRDQMTPERAAANAEGARRVVEAIERAQRDKDGRGDRALSFHGAVPVCARCGGTGKLDDRGFMLTGQPCLFTVDCPDCKPKTACGRYDR